MSKNTEHTPTPWTEENGTIYGPDDLDYVAIDGASIVSEHVLKANAEHIVRAVNSHERLIQALSELVAEHDVSNENIPMGYGPKPDTFGIELARAALAEGETP
jgi:hypothetical protein